MKHDVNAVIPKWQSKNTYLDDRVGLYPSEKDPEIEVFHISFKYYNNHECEIRLLEKNRARKMLLDLKTIGKCYNLNSLKENGIDILLVNAGGDYKKLFSRNITEDVDMKEHKIQSTSRLFYFIASKMFYIVAIKNSHYETNKHRK